METAHTNQPLLGDTIGRLSAGDALRRGEVEDVQQHLVDLFCTKMPRGALLKQLQYAYACCRGFQPGLMQILAFFCFAQRILSQEILPNLPNRLL